MPERHEGAAPAARMATRDVLHRDLVAAGAPLHPGAVLRAWLVSPQVQAVWLYRLSAHFVAKGAWGRLLSKYFSVKLIRRYGCHISPHAQIGPGLSLPHPAAIVVGKGVRIGTDVTLYQSVTLGLRSRTSARGYPRIGDGAVVYAGAVVVGDVCVPDHASVGANRVVTCHAPAPTTSCAGPA